MGMMSMPETPQQGMPAAPQQGMMGGQGTDPTISHGHYNGVVMSEGQPVEIKAGIGEVEGRPIVVSDNGAIVADTSGKLVGYIKDGQLMKVDEKYLQLMQSKGYVQ